MGDDIKSRPGMEFIAEIPDGASVRFVCDGSILIAHPDHPLKRIAPDGSIEEMKPNDITISAMEEARAGGLPQFSSVAELMEELDRDD